MYTNILQFICTILLFSCLETRTPGGKIEFFQIYPYLVTDTINVNGVNRIIGMDSYLILNAPKDTFKLRRIIDSFNVSRNLSVGNFEHFTQSFYKEWKVTTKNYYDSKHNDDEHNKDLIAEYGWVDFGEIRFYFFYRNGKLLTKRESVKLSEVEEF